MSHIKRKYIDSHWLVFIFQGIITLIFGCFMLFTSNETSTSMIPLIGIAILALSVVEFSNSLHRTRHHVAWVVSTLLALFDAAFGIALLLLTERGMAWHLILLASYTILRGIFELLVGFRTTVDPTDRFIWNFCGLAGIVFGVAIFNSGHLANVDFIRFFGAYLLILATSSLIYGIHNRSQQIEDREARRESAKLTKTSSSSALNPSAKSAAKKSGKSAKGASRKPR